MTDIKKMLVNGCNIIYCTDKGARERFYQKFVVENPEYDFDIRKEFLDNRKKGIFGASIAFNILKKNKTIKGRYSVEEIIALLKSLDIYSFADRIPRTMSNQTKVMYSVAYDILESGRSAFILNEGGRYTREVLAYVATRVRYCTGTRELKFVWVTDTAPNTEEVLNSCDNLLELKDGELISHNVKDACKPVKKEETVGEIVVTYEGFDTSKQAHIIHTADAAGRVLEYTYDSDDVEFVDNGIKKGDRVNMEISFNDAKGCLKFHLSKYNG